MAEPVIRVAGLSKRYVLGHQRNRHDGLRHRLEEAVRHPWQWARARVEGRRSARELFWALKDVSFDVSRGEVVGVIGRNGAGKSTLFKTLSRITEPTAGRIELEGRVASLLEVGTGFHPELTGRENIFLNGAILGMSKLEIRRRFDQIVAFAEVEKFLDTPVKRYSSGMYVRLAFAVAAHLEPEILIIDEVLAVGDAEFQAKCLGRMGAIAREGRTILFVSHNMEAITRLCTRALLLREGALAYSGPTREAVALYLNKDSASTYAARGPRGDTPRVEKAWLADAAGAPRDVFRPGEPVAVALQFHNPQAQELEVALAFFDPNGTRLWNFTHQDYRLPPLRPEPGRTVRLTFSPPPLRCKQVFVHVGLLCRGHLQGQYADHITEGFSFFLEEPAAAGPVASDFPIHCAVRLDPSPT